MLAGIGIGNFTKMKAVHVRCLSPFSSDQLNVKMPTNLLFCGSTNKTVAQRPQVCRIARYLTRIGFEAGIFAITEK